MMYVSRYIKMAFNPTMPNKDLHIMKISELEPRMQGVAFEGLVINRYGTYDAFKTSSFFNVHAHLTYADGLATVTVFL